MWISDILNTTITEIMKKILLINARHQEEFDVILTASIQRN